MAIGGNPVFNNPKAFRGSPAGSAAVGSTVLAGQTQLSSQQLQDLYNQPSAGPAQTGRMTYDDVIMKTLACLALVVVGGAIGWMYPILMIPGMIVGLVLGLVNAFKKEPSKGLILAYAGAEGLFVGGLSMVIDRMYPGVAPQAVLGTVCVFAVTLLLFKSGKVRATPKAMRFFMIALIGYALFSLVNLGLMWFGVLDNQWGVRGVEFMGIPLGVIIGLFAIGLAAFSLIVDFTSIEQGVKQGVDRKYSWTAAFGLTVTLIWLYVEILRLLAILRGDE
ncbi:Bax inhibitor-1/YccA family protein [Arthrobacter sulfonylureivorans]|uniref:Bax inhibitor-1/YccA family protein n=1 Tax=Arthrobacter sulfonylureivorans TaxID=2486855 RepID=A0ABY3W8Y9_9MICC|nr:Bax inhibitor-1/YccA family protein [Arthrobacter sulfonylureivorans]UNK45038.1 Bax inhibitor-1/YccA family protein [Arthrobacter sulfonylureivorans]